MRVLRHREVEKVPKNHRAKILRQAGWLQGANYFLLLGGFQQTVVMVMAKEDGGNGSGEMMGGGGGDGVEMVMVTVVVTVVVMMVVVMVVMMVVMVWMVVVMVMVAMTKIPDRSSLRGERCIVSHASRPQWWPHGFGPKGRENTRLAGVCGGGVAHFMEARKQREKRGEEGARAVLSPGSHPQGPTPCLLSFHHPQQPITNGFPH
jgi:hypothetical protein